MDPLPIRRNTAPAAAGTLQLALADLLGLGTNWIGDEYEFVNSVSEHSRHSAHFADDHRPDAGFLMKAALPGNHRWRATRDPKAALTDTFAGVKAADDFAAVASFAAGILVVALVAHRADSPAAESNRHPVTVDDANYARHLRAAPPPSTGGGQLARLSSYVKR